MQRKAVAMDLPLKCDRIGVGSVDDVEIGLQKAVGFSSLLKLESSERLWDIRLSLRKKR